MPSLYRVRLALALQNGVAHELTRRFGFRTFELRPRDGLYRRWRDRAASEPGEGLAQVRHPAGPAVLPERRTSLRGLPEHGTEFRKSWQRRNIEKLTAHVDDRDNAVVEARFSGPLAGFAAGRRAA